MHKEKTSISFKILNAVITQFAVFEENQCGARDDSKFDSTLKFSFKDNDKTVKVISGTTYLQRERPVVRCEVEITFKIRLGDEEEDVKLTSILNRNHLVYFGSKAVGILRGVLLSKLENTQIKFILPLVNIEKIIPQDIL